MADLFEDERKYVPEDPEIKQTLGSKEKQAQMRHRGTSPAYYRLGRKILYYGADLNAWAEKNRISQKTGIS